MLSSGMILLRRFSKLQICEAIVMVQPWLDRQDVMNLHCTEKEHYHDGDESFEVNLPSVHPTAHARPVFKSQFMVRDSIESEESNEVRTQQLI